MRLLRFALASLALVAGCSGAATPTAAPTQVVLMTHDSFAVSDDVVASFEESSGLTLEVLEAGDAGSVVNQAILTKNEPLADVLFGVDNTFLSRALDEDIFMDFRPAEWQTLPAELVLDPEFRVTPIDYGDVCVNYDHDAFPAESDAPQTFDDLANPAFDNQLVVENPATSSPGLAFMLATIARFGENDDYDWLDFWAGLRANGFSSWPAGRRPTTPTSPAVPAKATSHSWCLMPPAPRPRSYLRIRPPTRRRRAS